MLESLVTLLVMGKYKHMNISYDYSQTYEIRLVVMRVTYILNTASGGSRGCAV